MIKERYQVIQFPVIHPAFYAERALADGRQADLGRNIFTHVCVKTQTLEARRREDNGVVLPFFQLSQPRVDISPELMDHKVGPQVHELRLSPETARADVGALGQVLEREVMQRDQRVSRVLTLCNGAEMQTVGKERRHVLHTVDGDVDLP